MEDCFPELILWKRQPAQVRTVLVPSPVRHLKAAGISRTRNKDKIFLLAADQGQKLKEHDLTGCFIPTLKKKRKKKKGSADLSLRSQLRLLLFVSQCLTAKWWKLLSMFNNMTRTLYWEGVICQGSSWIIFDYTVVYYNYTRMVTALFTAVTVTLLHTNCRQTYTVGRLMPCAWAGKKKMSVFLHAIFRQDVFINFQLEAGFCCLSWAAAWDLGSKAPGKVILLKRYISGLAKWTGKTNAIL